MYFHLLGLSIIFVFPCYFLKRLLANKIKVGKPEGNNKYLDADGRIILEGTLK